MWVLYILIAVSAVIYLLAQHSVYDVDRLRELCRITFWTSLAVALVAVYLK
jgi:hypothetical protein